MAKSKAKAAKAGGATAVAAASPYVQRLIQDAELRDNRKLPPRIGRFYNPDWPST